MLFVPSKRVTPVTCNVTTLFIALHLLWFLQMLPSNLFTLHLKTTRLIASLVVHLVHHPTSYPASSLSLPQFLPFSIMSGYNLDSHFHGNNALLGISSPNRIAALQLPKTKSCSSSSPAICITPSTLRPTVCAPDCFIHWVTPYGVQCMNELSVLTPPSLVVRKRNVMFHSVSGATLSSYSAGLICFTKFCDEYSIPEDLRMPASEALLSIIITTCGAGSVGQGSMRQWIAGLKLWHSIDKAPLYSLKG